MALQLDCFGALQFNSLYCITKCFYISDCSLFEPMSNAEGGVSSVLLFLGMLDYTSLLCTDLWNGWRGQDCAELAG